MTILLWGADDYRKREKERQLIADFSKKHSILGIRRFSLDETGEDSALADFLVAQSIFEPYKLALVSAINQSKDKSLVAAVKQAQKSKTVFIILSENEAPASPWTFLRQKGDKNEEVLEQKFDKLKEADWKRFVKGEVVARKIQISPEAVLFLEEVYEGDSWRLVTELDKISLLGKKEINKSDLERLGLETLPDFFPTLMALKSSDVKIRLRALEQLLLSNEPAAKIFNILSAQWYDRAEIMARYDLAVKSGKCEYEEVLLDMVLS